MLRERQRPGDRLALDLDPDRDPGLVLELVRRLGVDVVLEPDHTYLIWFNYDPGYMNFMDTDHNSAVPYLLSFHTAPE